MFSPAVLILFSATILGCSGEAPCSASELDELCQTSDDCRGEGAVCVEGSCQCHTSYIQFPSRGLSSSHCEKAPNAIDAVCSPPHSYCKPPLVCEGKNKCVCPAEGKKDQTHCNFTVGRGDSCSDSRDCTAPFTFCDPKSRKCACLLGTFQAKNGKCEAEPRCPDGSAPVTNQMCLSLVSTGSEVFDNIHNSAHATDTCKSGSYCVTDGSGDSVLGFCCPISSCPLGYPPNLNHSCSPNAKNKCPSASHFCHRQIGPSFSVSLCCRSPCSEAAPIYVGGTCYPRVSLNSSCTVDEQCDGGIGMQCWNGACWCRTGFKTKTEEPDAYQTCVKNCPLGLEDRCIPSKVPVSQSCAVSEQCGDGNAYCYAGVCRCRCGFLLAKGACLDPSKTSLAPGAPTTPASNPVNSAVNSLLDALKKFGFTG